MIMADNIPVASIIPNPDQPRKKFDPQALTELAASIKENGLIQPITVRSMPDGRYMIVAGERRYRAHVQAGLDMIAANVITINNEQRDVLAIVENLQRADITPLEEARAFQRMLDQGWTVNELAQRLGLKQPWRITDRTQLLRLLPAYLNLLEKGHLSPSQGFELSRLSPAGQATLFSMISVGRCETYARLRAAADGLLFAESQTTLFELPAPTREEAQLLTSFEHRIEAVIKLLASAFDNNEIIVLKKINPGRATIIATELSLMQKHIGQIERELQKVSAQGELLTA